MISAKFGIKQIKTFITIYVVLKLHEWRLFKNAALPKLGLNLK